MVCLFAHLFSTLNCEQKTQQKLSLGSAYRRINCYVTNYIATQFGSLD